MIRRAVAEGVSSRALASALQEAGLGIRRQTLLDVMRYVRGEERAASSLRFLPPGRLPNPARLPVAATRLRRQYSFTVLVRGTHISSGEPITRYVTISTSQLLPRESLEGTAAAMIDSEGDRYGMEIDSVQLVGGRKAGAAGLL